VKYVLQGFPSELSPELRLPGISEMIRAPMFMRAPLESVLEHGTDWQKRLLDATPFRHDRKFAMVSCGVHIQAPGYRTLAVGGKGVAEPHQDWHIDGERPDDHLAQEERVYLLQTACSSLTQFNARSFVLNAPGTIVRDRVQLAAYIRKRASSLGVRGRAVPPNRIVTFTSHLHRPVVAGSTEFRFFWRARESDRAIPSAPPGIGRAVKVWDIAEGALVDQILYGHDGIRVHMPDARKGRTLDNAAYNGIF
jgi:hypothetical protein